jgi:hypothetical protein
MNAATLLLTPQEVRDALSIPVLVERGQYKRPPQNVGNIVRTAAADSAFEHFNGHLLLDDEEKPFAVSIMALVFDAAGKAEHTFQQVATAAHLRTQLDGCNVAVETATAPSGLVSYWGFVQRSNALVIVTLDTINPRVLSIADLRSLVTATARHLTESEES